MIRITEVIAVDTDPMTAFTIFTEEFGVCAFGWDLTLRTTGGPSTT